MAFLGELIEADGDRWKVRVHHSLKGGDQDKPNRSIDIAQGLGGVRPRSGALLLALGQRKGDQAPAQFSWTAIVLNEASYSYVARSPTVKVPVADRLAYFIRYLEHADEQIAEDAYLELGHAPLDEIAKLADRLPVDHLREWLSDVSVPPERQGLYGLLLGLAASAQNRHEVADDFWRWITAPASDFRSGFDGVLGGYLWLGENSALGRLEKRYLDDPRASVGDLRHLQRALRVYHEYGRGIPKVELLRVYRRFLDRPALAAEAVGDLSRWQDWDAFDRVASLFGRMGYADAAIERAVIGYLLACPLPAADRQIARLRTLVPDRVAEAERPEAAQSGPK